MPIKDAFKKYDIRGTIEKDFKISDFYKITQSIIYYLKQKDSNIKNIAVGMDGRIHSNAIKKQVCDAIIDSGLNVIFIGLCPTPVLYYACYQPNFDAGIMITASHNPAQDNGLKIMLHKESIWDKDLKKIYEIFEADLKIKSDQKGNYQEENLVDEYIEFLTKKFEHLKNLNINAIVDCSNGTASTVMNSLVKKLNWKKCDLIFEEIDGNFPNHSPDPTNEKNLTELKKILKNNDYKFGLAFDGDCDRLTLMTKEGKLIGGDQLIAIYSQFLQEEHKSIAFDVKCSNGLIDLCNKLQINYSITPTGVAYIKQAMKEDTAWIGGELSGHFCFKDRYFGYDDGIYAMLRLIEILQDNNLEDLLDSFPKKITSNEIRISCEESQKKLIINDVKIKLSKLQNSKILEIDGFRIDLPYGWAILRSSNTEPILSMRFEGNTIDDLQQLKINFFNAISPYFPQEYLKEKFEL